MTSPPLLGRTEECAELRGALADANVDRVILIEITGQPGIGKTSLLDWLTTEATGEGFRCLRASAFRQEAHHRYGVLGSLLGNQRALTDLGELDDFDQAALASALPEFGRTRVSSANAAGGTSGGIDTQPIDQIDILHAVHRGLTVLARDNSGLLIMIDNAEWLDDLTLAALGFVCRRGVGTPLLVVTTSRQRSAETSLVTAATRANEIAVGPLSDSALEELLGDLSEHDRADVVAHARGNPFFALELAAYRRRRSSPLADEGVSESGALPISVTAAILDEVAALSEPARTMAQAGAVLGDGFDVRMAVRLAGLTEETGFRAVDELVDATLLVALPLGTFRFRHPLLAFVVYEAIPPGRRLELHEAAAEIITASGVDPIAAAWHFVASASIGDEHAITCIRLGAAASGGIAPRTTIALATAAIDLLPADGPLTSWRPHLSAYLADGLIRTGQLAEAERVVRQALAMLSRDDRTALALLTIMLFRIRRWRGDNVDQLATISAALDQVPPEQHYERALLGCMATIEAARASDVNGMRTASTQAEADAELSDQPTARLAVLIARALAESLSGDPNLAVQLADAAEDLLAVLPRSEVALIIDTVALLASVEQWLGRSEWSLSCASHGQSGEFEAGGERAKFWFTVAAGLALASMGRLGSAEETAEVAELTARELRAPDLITVGLALTADIATLKGDLNRARRCVEEMFLHLAKVPDSGIRVTTVTTVLPAMIALEDYERAISLMEYNVRDASLPEVPKPLRANIFEYLTIAELGRGNVDAAWEWSERANAIAAEIEFELSVCCAARGRAEVLAATEQLDAAVEQAEVAVNASRRFGRSPEIARSLLTLGRLCQDAGRNAEAIEALTESATLHASCGAAGPAAHARRLLRELGVSTRGQRSAGTAGLESLSGREREVAALVAEGLTNPQIAEQLFLSVRTVESHLSRIFTKLNVSSRAEVALTVTSHTAYP